MADAACQDKSGETPDLPDVVSQGSGCSRVLQDAICWELVTIYVYDSSMFTWYSFRSTQAMLVYAALAVLTLASAPVGAAPWSGNRAAFASPRFEQVWRAADQDVQHGAPDRSWTWGPQPWFDYKEVYKQSPGGLRQVQYFDKARMEISDPASSSGPLAGVTNGLLTVDLVSGRLKLGNGTGPDENRMAGPAELHVAGDSGAKHQFRSDHVNVCQLPPGSGRSARHRGFVVLGQ